MLLLNGVGLPSWSGPRLGLTPFTELRSGLRVDRWKALVCQSHPYVAASGRFWQVISWSLSVAAGAFLFHEPLPSCLVEQTPQTVLAFPAAGTLAALLMARRATTRCFSEPLQSHFARIWSCDLKPSLSLRTISEASFPCG